MTATLTTVPTSDLRPGDIVHTHGLRVRVPEQGMTPSNPNRPASHGGPMHYAVCQITNPEYLRTDAGRYLFGGIIALDGSATWTIQGNDFARWTVERPTDDGWTATPLDRL